MSNKWNGLKKIYGISLEHHGTSEKEILFYIVKIMF